MYYDRSFKIAKSYLGKMRKDGVERHDLVLTDHLAADKATAKVLIRYDSKFGDPTAEQVQRYVNTISKGVFVPQMESAKIHKDPGCVSVIVSMHRFTRELKHKEGMMKISGSCFIDTETDSTWEIAESETKGVKFLQRVNEENIDHILAERRKRIGVLPNAGKFCFANVVNAGVLSVSKGDYVQFYQNQLRKGEVTKTGQTEVSITADDGEIFVVSPTSITSIIRKSDASQKEQDQKNLDFYSKIYGPDFAKELMKFGSNV